MEMDVHKNTEQTRKKSIRPPWKWIVRRWHPFLYIWIVYMYIRMIMISPFAPYNVWDLVGEVTDDVERFIRIGRVFSFPPRTFEKLGVTKKVKND